MTKLLQNSKFEWLSHLCKSAFKANQGIMDDSRWIDQGSPYDFGSIMHYGARSCSKDGKDVITKPDGSPIKLTKTHSLSKHDIWQINQIYQCQKKPPPPTTTKPPKTTKGPTTKPPTNKCCQT